MASSVDSDGPVLRVVNNRIRALRMQLQVPTSQDNSVIWAVINELEKLYDVLPSVLAQELRQHSSNELQLEGTSTSQPHHHELIETNSGRASTSETAPMLLEEAVPSLVAPSSLVEQYPREEFPPLQIWWPSGRVPGFMADRFKPKTKDIGVLSISRRQLNGGEQGNLGEVIPYSPVTPLSQLSLLLHRLSPERQRSLGAPFNVTLRLPTREFNFMFDGVYENRRVQGDNSLALTQSGNSQWMERAMSLLTLIRSFVRGNSQWFLSSSSLCVILDRAWSFLRDQGWSEIHLPGIATFYTSGNFIAALLPNNQILLYDIQNCQLLSRFSDTSIGKPVYSQIHFHHSDSMLLWNGVLWDPRASVPVHRSNQITDFEGEGFHPAGNEVIVNSQVRDLRNLRLHPSVPSLQQTPITVRANIDQMHTVIVRRCMEGLMSALLHTRRVMNDPLATFRIADFSFLHYSTQTTNSIDGLLTMYNNDEFRERDVRDSTVRIYEIGDGRTSDEDEGSDGDSEDAIVVTSNRYHSLRELGDQEGEFVVDDA
ncbi:DDB1- and CUL4-associated factor-like 1, partial [Mucuna pruriens]